ncbi:hypothetical protein [Spirosoma montaniterrae]|uniref:Copper homeostasis protein n=1 Tax=Spirosoma montaniterrae TaxID=1178516 RepID=A0A1P9WXN0_9BACT|nr:hypothetical protein [Spirosoma montaniterrae]AQG80120.1 hypothetical protein AWR27_12770 [Spirosoma montaniterrae]
MNQFLNPILLVGVALLAACQGQKKTDETTSTTVATGETTAAVTTAPAPQCYAYYSAKDTVSAQLTMMDTTVAGTLLYRLSGKDANTGTLSGRMMGDTLMADYTFMSEGQESVRQVAFLVKNNELSEGYGNVSEQNGKMVFSDKSGLKFPGTMVLKKVDCSK